MAFTKFTDSLIGATAVAAAMLVASCAPIYDGGSPSPAAGDDPAVRALANELSLAGDSAAGAVATNNGKCSNLGGSYSRQGLAGFHMCVLPYSSAGKTCTAKSDCHGDCIATPGKNHQGTSPGKCQATTVPFGCFATIDDNGNVGGTICRD